MIAGERIELLLRRSARRSFALQVDHRGARVAVPLRTSLAAVERFVHQHGAWLIERLQARAAAPRPALFEIVDGAQLKVLGELVRLRLAAVRSAQWRASADGEELVLPASRPVAALQRALQVRALTWHRERVHAMCAALGCPTPPVALTNARTRWGSCSTRSGIRLHWRLIHLPPVIIDYVVAHEVAHLLEMNHSPRFWAVVEKLYPDWRLARRQLRAAAASLPVIAERAAEEPCAPGACAPDAHF